LVGAAIVEFRHQDGKHVVVNLTCLTLIAFVSLDRFGAESFR
jgi:hypothetical protein